MNEPNAPRSRASGPAIFAGILLGPLVVYGVTAIASDDLALVTAGAGAIGAIVLIARGEPTGRGLGIGVLIGFAIILLLYGALYAACSPP